MEGYTPGETIFTSGRTLIYRAQRQADEQSVIVKTTRNPTPTPPEIRNLEREYQLTRLLEHKGVIRALELEYEENRPCILFEDIQGTTLAESYPEPISSLKEFLNLALVMASALELVHKNGLLHKSINPGNILVNRNRNALKLIDFGSASKLSHEMLTPEGLGSFAGALAYMAPEQTGYLNGRLDARCDYYSLGAVYYRLLTARPPIQAETPTEALRGLAYDSPPPLEQLRPDVPPAISRMVLKLLAREPDDRYRSLRGLRTDLLRCRDELLRLNKTPDFQPGAEDTMSKPEFPHKFFGRQAELEQLSQALGRVRRNGREFTLIKGDSGLGKARLVQEFLKQVLPDQALFINGRWSAAERSIPYSALSDGFHEYLRRLQAEGGPEVQTLRESLVKALGPLRGVLYDLLPELENLTGAAPVPPELPPDQSRLRMFYLFQKFIGVLGSSERPLILFLEDLQWADPAGMDLILYLLGDAHTAGLHIIGAYQGDEQDSEHPLKTVLHDLNWKEMPHQILELKPLTLPEIRPILSLALKRDEGELEELAQLFLDKSGGNPFYLRELFNWTAKEGFPKPGTELKPLSGRPFPETAMECIFDRMAYPGETARELLIMLACQGAGGRTDFLHQAFTGPESRVDTALEELVGAELVYRSGSRIRFTHDLVREAALQMIPSGDRDLMSYRISNYVVRAAGPEKEEPRAFFLVNQLEAGEKNVRLFDERQQALKLYLRAGRKARRIGALEAAMHYFSHALHFLESDAWRTDFTETLDLHLETARSAVLVGNHQLMEEITEKLLPMARNNLETFRIQEEIIQAHLARGKHAEALELGLAQLKELGMGLPPEPSELFIKKELAATRLLLSGRDIAGLTSLPESRQDKKQAAGRLISTLLDAALAANPKIYTLFMLRLLRWTIKGGRSSYSPDAAAGYGLMLADRGIDLNQAHLFGELALNFSETALNQHSRARIILLVNQLIRPWKESLKKTSAELPEIFENALRNGDRETAALAALNQPLNLDINGGPLDQVLKETEIAAHRLYNLENRLLLTPVLICRQKALNLSTESSNPTHLGGSSWNEENNYAELNENPIGRAYYLYSMIQLNYIFGDYANAYEYQRRAEEILPSVYASPLKVMFTFYGALTRLALYRTGIDADKKLLVPVRKNLKRLRHWARMCPENQAHRSDLIEAQLAWALGREKEARSYFDLAIHDARSGQFLFEYALADESYALMLYDQGHEELARIVYTRAYQAYARWGAVAKNRLMEKLMPGLLEAEEIQPKQTAALPPAPEVAEVASRPIQIKTEIVAGPAENAPDSALELEAVNRLQAEVKASEEQLQESQERLRRMEARLGNEYHRTSQLMGSLELNAANSDRVKLDFIVKQKQTINSKQGEEELGGDICISHTLQLNNRPHTVFLNADASGRSTRGARGALILGALFQSIIHRAQDASFDESQSSLRWLKEAIRELGQVLEDFQGRAPVSLVLGTLDDQEGELNFINMAHPAPVLYREGRARFLSENGRGPRLGVPGKNEKLRVFRFRLQAGDTLIVGSDGRDHILLPTGNNGHRILNTDRSIFLTEVENSGGELNKLYEIIREQGELADDLSLMRLGYS